MHERSAVAQYFSGLPALSRRWEPGVLLINGGGSRDDRSVSRSARGRRPLTSSCLVSWSFLDEVPSYPLSPSKPFTPQPIDCVALSQMRGDTFSPSTEPPPGSLANTVSHRCTHIYGRGCSLTTGTDTLVEVILLLFNTCTSIAGFHFLPISAKTKTARETLREVLREEWGHVGKMNVSGTCSSSSQQLV